MDGFSVMTMDKAALWEIFTNLQASRCHTQTHFNKMKKGAQSNAGHFNVEISIPDLEDISMIFVNIKISWDIHEGWPQAISSGRGRLVNLVC